MRLSNLTDIRFLFCTVDLRKISFVCCHIGGTTPFLDTLGLFRWPQHVSCDLGGSDDRFLVCAAIIINRYSNAFGSVVALDH